MGYRPGERDMVLMRCVVRAALPGGGAAEVDSRLRVLGDGGAGGDTAMGQTLVEMKLTRDI